jgi:carboxylate-amine ligase
VTETEPEPYRLFDGIGVEIEYAIVDRESLAVRPISDQLLRLGGAEPVNEIERDETRWSNELVQHVIELKSNGPARDLERFRTLLRADVREIDARLAPLGARLMPTAMHPLMVPARDTRLWPHGQNEIYATYDRIFDCSGHGWSNLQSMHLNFPFSGDDEFARLHAAIRIVLPILPALAASSPFEEGRLTGRMDTRLWHYRNNQKKLPQIAGYVVPERAFTEADYVRLVLEPIERAVRPFDTAEVLEAEWVNSRGAIARFSRGAVEIRLIDVQECPRMDLAVAALVVETARALVEERWSSHASQRGWDETRLASMLFSAADRGSDAVFDDPEYAPMFGLPRGATPASTLIEHLVSAVAPSWAASDAARIVGSGCLAQRICRAVGPNPDAAAVLEVYRDLCECLVEDRPFAS